MRKTLLLLAVFVSTIMSAQERVRLTPTTSRQTQRSMAGLTDPAAQRHSTAVKTDATRSADNYVTEQPEGELRTYVRDGWNYISYLGGVMKDYQDGQTLKVVFAPDGKTVWFYEIVAAASDCFGWVKGEFNDTKDRITVKEGQYAWFYDYGTYYTGYKVCRIKPNPEGTQGDYDMYEYTAGDIVYSYSADGSIALMPDEDGVAAIGLVRDTTDPFLVEYGYNGKWLGYGDSDSKYTPFEENFNQAPDESLQREDYSLTYDIDMAGTRFGHMVKTVFDNDKVYIQGIFASTLPEAWIEGTVDNGKVTFRMSQQLGIYARHYTFLEGGTYEMKTDPETGEEYLAMIPAEELVFSLDKDGKTMTADGQVMVSSSGVNNYLINESYISPTLKKYDDVALKPEKPEIISYTSEPDDYGQRYVTVAMKSCDVDGNFIDPTRLYLGIFINGEPFTFKMNEYYTLSEDMTYLPFGFSDGWFFNMEQTGVLTIALMTPEISTIGAKCYYEGGGTTTESDMAEYVTSGIETAVCDEVESVVYHDITGRRVDVPAGGIFIKTVTFKDGSRKSVKISDNTYNR